MHFASEDGVEGGAVLACLVNDVTFAL